MPRSWFSPPLLCPPPPFHLEPVSQAASQKIGTQALWLAACRRNRGVLRLWISCRTCSIRRWGRSPGQRWHSHRRWWWHRWALRSSSRWATPPTDTYLYFHENAHNRWATPPTGTYLYCQGKAHNRWATPPEMPIYVYFHENAHNWDRLQVKQVPPSWVNIWEIIHMIHICISWKCT